MVYLLEAIIESPLPFLFAYASDQGAPDPDLLKRIEGCGKGCAVKFAPQWAVLDHPATGYFLVSGCTPQLVPRSAELMLCL
jgi:hypothetical protein